MEECAEQFLVQAEIFYLRAHGWRSQDAQMEWWVPPADYYWDQKRGLRHGREHAVNSQKAAIRDARQRGKKSRLLRLAEFLETRMIPINHSGWREAFTTPPRSRCPRRKD